MKTTNTTCRNYVYISIPIVSAATCGGKDNIPKPPDFKKLQADILNKSLNNTPISQDEMKSLSAA
jgi:hypothetical protein